jgi:hypothetical protein
MLRAAILRRQLTASQRAALAVELQQYRELEAEGRARQRANLRQLAEVATLPPRGKTRDLAAAWAGVSARTPRRRRGPNARPRSVAGLLTKRYASRAENRCTFNEKVIDATGLEAVTQLVARSSVVQISMPHGHCLA